ncbi:MAG: NADP-dependent oxidoreductase [Bacteroidia bacterium]|nr:NADP-dependent oxidoreductase [Bacteroidia bacterium]
MPNKQLIFEKRPIGLPEKDTWSLKESPIPEPGDGQFVVKQKYISLDPAMRGWMNDMKSYIPPVQIGEVMRAGSVGEIIASKHAQYPVGMHVSGWGGVQQYCLTDGQGFYPVDPSLAPLQTYIGTLGMPGMTAYFGFIEVGKPKEGDIVLVSGAAGAVGSVVGQIAKIKGCYVVGIAGTDEKCKYLVDELGFDDAFNYKTESIREGVRRTCPKGIDIYFDNVGGETLDAALAKLRRNARIVICGAISQYNNREAVKGPANYLSLLVNRASMTGIVVMDWAHRFKEGATQLGTWMMEGKLKSKEDVYEGIENFYDTFLRLFSGEKMGKLILKVEED